MSVEKVFNFLSKAYNFIEDEGKKMQRNIDREERSRASRMDDYDLMHDYDRLRNYDGDNYRAQARKERVGAELKRRDYEVDDF